MTRDLGWGMFFGAMGMVVVSVILTCAFLLGRLEGTPWCEENEAWARIDPAHSQRACIAESVIAERVQR